MAVHQITLVKKFGGRREQATDLLPFSVGRRPLLVLRLSKKRKEIYDNR